MCVASIDAKDLYVAGRSPKGEYTLKLADGRWNYRKFINTIPYSLDLIQLRDVYYRAYRNRRFSWWDMGKEYTTTVVNVTFKYSVKSFNRINKYTYLRLGYAFGDLDMSDCICVQDGELVAIEVGRPVAHPVDAEVLAPYFRYDGECYVEDKSMPVDMSRADLRHELYENGFDIDGVHYVRFKRSSGSARVGKCLFIDARMYTRMHNWDLCGLQVYKWDYIDIAAFESYISLTSSSIIDTMYIQPENILLIDDYTSKFRDDAVATYLDKEGNVRTEHMEVEVANSIWDGQSLMDTSLFGNYSKYGFLLLRNRFFKSAAFHCNIQAFFRDNGITSVSQLRGKTRAKRIEDIKLITTPSSIKYLKFGSFDAWLDNLDPMFGVVKHEKPTHHFGGRLVQTHYQLINTLQMTQAEVGELLAPSLEYMHEMKTIPAVFRDYIKYPDNMVLGEEPLVSKNEVTYKMLGLTEKFTHTRLYKDFRDECIKSFLRDMRKGRILVNGTYCTMCGNPMEMLRSSIGDFRGESSMTPGTVYTTRFAHGQKILGSRSPHVTMGNVLLTVNTFHPEIARYFRPTPEIVYVNSINENLLERLSGCDFDSDSMLMTDNEILIRAAERNYDKFAVPTRLINAVTKKTAYLNNSLAELDIKTSDNKIGEIINLSQELNTRLWHMVNNGAAPDSKEVQDLYCDIAFLDVLSNLEIDRAKKTLPVDNAAELAKLKRKHSQKDVDGRNIKPNFFKPVAQAKGYYNIERNVYKRHDTSMDYVQAILNKRKNMPRDYTPDLPFFEMLENEGPRNPQRKRMADKIIAAAQEHRAKMTYIWSQNRDMGTSERYALAERERATFQNYLARLRFDNHSIKYLFRVLETKEHAAIRSLLFYSLFSLPNKSIYDMLEQQREYIPKIAEDPLGDIDIFGVRHSVVIEDALGNVEKMDTLLLNA